MIFLLDVLVQPPTSSYLFYSFIHLASGDEPLILQISLILLRHRRRISKPVFFFFNVGPTPEAKSHAGKCEGGSGIVDASFTSGFPPVMK